VSKRISRIVRLKDGVAIDLGARLETALRRHWEDYRKAFKRCRRKLSEGAVHKLRVETRRLLSLLDLIEPLSDRQRTGKARRRFKKVLGAFARLRDTQVQRLAFETKFCHLPESGAVLQALRQREEKLVRKAGKKMDDIRLDELKGLWKSAGRLSKAHTNGGHSPRRDAQVVTRPVDDAYAAVMKLRRSIEPGRPATIHRMRVGFKKFRYMVEALEDVLAVHAAVHVKEMQSFQTLMGDIQDSEVLLADLEKLHSKEIISAATLKTLRAELLRKRSKQIAGFMGAKDQIARFWSSRSRSGAVKVKET